MCGLTDLFVVFIWLNRVISDSSRDNPSNPRLTAAPVGTLITYYALVSTVSHTVHRRSYTRWRGVHVVKSFTAQFPHIFLMIFCSAVGFLGRTFDVLLFCGTSPLPS
ncbi:hypothetical protein BDR07DRAFT_754455 [Suillus spraguei]|nr:hypothetical protein BDR07DRAFT_754455 [Suillus spraguei]